jgi:DNA primase
LTREQAAMIHRFAQEVTLIYDGDQAGIKAALRGIDILLENDLRVRVIALADNEDPDTLARRLQGNDLKDFLITNAQDFMSFQQNLLLKEAGRDPLRISSALQVVAASIACVGDPLLRATYVRQLAEDAGLPDVAVQEAVAQQFKLRAKSIGATNPGLASSPSANPQPPTAQIAPSIPHSASGDAGAMESGLQQARFLTEGQPWSDVPQEMEILRLLLLVGNHPMDEPDGGAPTTLLDYMSETLQTLPWDSPECKYLLDLCLQRWRSEGSLPNFHELMNHPEQTVAAMATLWFTENPQISPNWDQMHDIAVPPPSDNLKKEIETTFDRLLLKKVLRLSRLKQSELKDLQSSPGGLNHPQIPELIKEIQELKEAERRITARTGIVITH